MLTNTFDKPNKQSDTDKLSKIMSYISFFVLNFKINRISKTFSITMTTLSDKTDDLLNSLSALHPPAIGFVKFSTSFIIFGNISLTVMFFKILSFMTDIILI